MATALVTALLDAKMKHPKTSIALYSVSSDVDGVTIGQQLGKCLEQAIAEMLKTSGEPLNKDPHLIASLLQGAMAGVSRNLLESDHPEEHFAPPETRAHFLRPCLPGSLLHR